jgi:hypothetical protein
MADERQRDPMSGDAAGEIPFPCRIEPPEAATAQEVELNAELALDMADAATEEALLP